MRLNTLTVTLLIALVVLIGVGAYYFGRQSAPAPQTPVEAAAAQSMPVTPSADAAPEPPAPPAQPAADVTPAAFRGEWNSKLEDCGTGRNDSRLVIGQDTVRFYESSGAIKSVSASGRNATFVTELSGEGETWDFSYTFQLSEDGQTLTDTASGLVRQRCPA